MATSPIEWIERIVPAIKRLVRIVQIFCLALFYVCVWKYAVAPKHRHAKSKNISTNPILPMKNQHQKRVKMSVKMSKISTGSKKVAQTITTITAISGATSTWCQCWSILPGGPAHHSSPALSEYYVILKKMRNAQKTFKSSWDQKKYSERSENRISVILQVTFSRGHIERHLQL